MPESGLESYLYAQRFYFLAEQSLNIMQKNLLRILREYGINHTQHLILLVLRYAELSGNEVISTDIAYLLGLEKHSITTVVDKLVDRGLVVRDRSTKDRRVVHLGLTEEGRSLAAAIQERTVAEVSVVPDHAREEFAHMCEFLTTLRAHIASQADQSPQNYERAYRSLLLEGQAAFAKDLGRPAVD